MANIKTMLCAVSLLGLSVGCMAGSDSGFYLGAAVGSTSSTFDYSDYNGSEGYKFDGDDTGYKFFAGYNFGLLPLLDLAVEGSYVDFGEASDDFGGIKATSETTAWDLFGVAGFNLGPVGLFGKMGMVAWDSDTLVENVNNYKASSDGNDMAYGIGAKFQLMSFSVRAEYEVFEIEDVDTDMISIGAAFTF